MRSISINISKEITIYGVTFALLILLVALPLESRAQTDSLHFDLDETVYVSKKHRSSVKSVDGTSLKVNIAEIQNLPKILGNTDPLSFVKMLPGVQTGSEMDSGINVQGCDNAHNDFSVSGVPVYGATHLFGLFSIFNPSHYTEMTFRHSRSSGADANRLGGVIRMELPDSLEGKVGGEFSAGIMSSQGTLGIRTGKKSYLRLSARRSYLNLLYGRWLSMDNNPMEYGFGDYNLTWSISAGENDKLWIDAYFGNDKAFLGAEKYNIDLNVSWGNLMGALHWLHKGDGFTLKQTAYFTGYRSNARLSQDNSFVYIPASIGSAAYRAKADIGIFSFGADLTAYRIMPQAPEQQGLYGENTAVEIQNGAEADIWADCSYSFNNGIDVSAGLKAEGFFNQEDGLYGGVSPFASVSWNLYRWGRINASYGIQHQYIFQTGISNIGLPMDFWFMAGKYSRPQWAQSAALNYKLEMFGGEIALSADLYYKRLYNQVEYHGDLFDFFTTQYHLQDHILKGKGHNYGVNLMIHKQAGSFTGWISYSLGRALRSFDNPDFPDLYPANHERIHDLSAVASYKWNKWDFAGTFVFSSGRPFTAPESFYITSGGIITNYGKHNGCRLRPYVRLDLSVNRIFRKTDRMENGINLSVYNVLARENEVMWRLRINDNGFAYRPMSLFLKLMPSISYYHKF